MARPEPDWVEVHRELKGKGVTLELLWDEYKAANPDGYRYSTFCQYYRRWRNRLDVVMRQDHRAGEKLFVDYAGQTASVIDRHTGEVKQAQIFVAVMGASNYTYAEATRSQGLSDWIGSHVRAMEYFGAAPEIVVPDNLKAGVNKPHRYEPKLNRTYREWGEHYGVAILPARPKKPRDKAKAEAGVLVVERWILARLRHRQVFSLAELNEYIGELLERLNTRPFQKLPGCRRELFESLDRPAMRSLPPRPYEYAEWKKVRVNVDYHVEVDRHCYSAPYQLIKQQLDARIAANTVELLHKGRRGQSCPQLAPRQPHHGARAHAREPPRTGQVDAATVDRLGRQDRPLHRGRGQAHPGHAQASAAGLSHLPRDHPPGRAVRAIATGGRLQAGDRARRLRLQEHRVDPEERARKQAPAAFNPGTARDRA